MEKDPKRIAIGKLAAQERWNSTTPKATHTGVLIIAGQEIHCDVLNDGRRILRQKTLAKAMGKASAGGRAYKRSEEYNLPVFLTANNLTPYLTTEFLDRSNLIIYKGIDGRKQSGYDATVLPEACKIYVQADHENDLPANQKKIVTVCKAMLYALATVGITALVDDATGYVYERERNELQKVLEQYIAKELLPWTKKFPDEFFEQVYRLQGWHWPKINKNHPQYVGQLINEFVYEGLSPEVLKELKNQNPTNENGNRRNRFHQHLTELGNSSLDKQVVKVVTLMKVSKDMDQFRELFDRC